MKTLRTILKERGISQNIVAESLGVDASNLRRYDDLRKRSLEEILKISEATGIPFDDLTGVGIDKTGILQSVKTGNNSVSSLIGNGNSNVNISHGSERTYPTDKQEIDALEKKIVELEARLKEKDEFIKMLLDRK